MSNFKCISFEILSLLFDILFSNMSYELIWYPSHALKNSQDLEDRNSAEDDRKNGNKGLEDPSRHDLHAFYRKRY